MIKYLITGGNGFIGSHLIDLLEKQENSIGVWGKKTTLTKDSKAIFYDIDITVFQDVKEWLNKHQPEIIIHLAAKSIPTKSWLDPFKTFEVNTLSTINIINSIEELNIRTKKFMFVGTSAQYKSSGEKKIKEETDLSPSSPYAISKIAAEQYLKIKCLEIGIDLIIFRPFYFIGAHKKGDFSSELAKQIILIEKGKKEFLELGNINLIRDFLDVRDGVEAIKKLIEFGVPFTNYNVCSGKGTNLKDLLKLFINESSVKINYKLDKTLIRSNEDKIRIGSPDKINNIGWFPKYEMKQTVSHILRYWRKNYDNM